MQPKLRKKKREKRKTNKYRRYADTTIEQVWMGMEYAKVSMIA